MTHDNSRDILFVAKKIVFDRFILEVSGIRNIQTGRHTCRMCQHDKRNSQRQVDTHAECVDTVRRIIKDRLTHMQHVLTQLEELSKTGRHTWSMCRHS